MINLSDNYKTALKNKYFSLLCVFEEQGEWEQFLNSILIELEGFEEEKRGADYEALYHKTATLRFLSYKYFRSTIFDCMSLLGKKKVEDIYYDKSR